MKFLQIINLGFHTKTFSRNKSDIWKLILWLIIYPKKEVFSFRGINFRFSLYNERQKKTCKYNRMSRPI